METRLPAASSALTRDEGDSPRSDDLFFREAKVEPILKALNGRKHLIVGNHDHTWMKRVEASDRKVWGLSPRELRTIFSPRFAKSA